MFGFNFDKRTLYMIIGIILVMSLMSGGIGDIFGLILAAIALILHWLGII